MPRGLMNIHKWCIEGGMQREPITPEGHERLKQELHRLKTKDRPAVSQQIAAAREHGDLKENAEYHAAREKQGLMEARIRDMEHLLALAQVIDHKKLKSDKVIFGSTVTVKDLNSGQSKKYQLVGRYETDVKSGKIPISSPIAKALIGKKCGESIAVQVPRGLQEFEITRIEFI